MHNQKSKEKAAVRIQTSWRGFNVRKKYSVKQLSNQELKNHFTFIVGNDPVIKGLDKHISQDEKIAVIGTSGLRSLAIALTLSPTNLPKLIIVDNSSKVIAFWRKLRDVANELTKQGADETQCLDGFRAFLKDNNELYHKIAAHAYDQYSQDQVKYENQNPIVYLKGLVDEFGLKKVLSVINYASIIQQSWTNPGIFAVLKNICELNGQSKLIAYPSNIAHTLSEKDSEKVFESVELLSPKLSIFTDRCKLHGIPKKVFLSEHKTKQDFKQQVAGSGAASRNRMLILSLNNLLNFLLSQNSDVQTCMKKDMTNG